MRKILFVATESAVGMLPFASAVINEASIKGDEVYAITVSKPHEQYANRLNGNVHHFNISFPSSVIGKLVHKFSHHDVYHKILEFAKIYDISEVCLLTGEYGLTCFYAHSLRRRFNVSFIVHDLHAHPSEWKGVKEWLFQRFFTKMTQKAVRTYDNLITCSKQQVSELKERYPAKNIRFMKFPSLVSPEMMSSSVKPAEIRDDTSPFVLFFGRVEYYKGVDILCDAFLNSELSKHCSLVIAGKGDSLCIDEKESGVLHLNRFISDAEVSWLFKHAKSVVYPYRQATMSGVLTIAHYFNTPVIASDLPFFKDYCDDADTLFPSEDIKALSSVLDRVNTL